MTPEGYSKRDLKKLLSEYTNLYSHWPVLNGMGTPELDCNIIYKGFDISIECKAPGEDFTPRQCDTSIEKQRAGGIVLGYRGKLDDQDVRTVLDNVGSASASAFAAKQLIEKQFIVKHDGRDR